MPGIKIIFEDKDMCVVYKPAGLATQSGQVGRKDLVSELKKMLAKQAALAAGKEASAKGIPGKGASDRGAATAKKGAQEPYLALIHRLDQPVEGLLVFAKNKRAAASLSAQLDDHTLKKSYVAALWGNCAQESGELVDYMYKDADNRAQIVDDPSANPEARRASLTYEVTARKCVDTFNITLVRVTLNTGRFHQIRAQMAHMGHPLLGDNKYGTEESLAASSKLGVTVPALCANTITVKHPTNGQEMEFQVIPENSAFRLFIG